MFFFEITSVQDPEEKDEAAKELEGQAYTAEAAPTTQLVPASGTETAPPAAQLDSAMSTVDATKQAAEILEEAKQQAAKILEEAKAKANQQFIRKSSSSDFKTPPRKPMVLSSPPSCASSESSNTRKIQHSLSKFWGSPEEQASNEPVLAMVEVPTRVKRSRAMQEVESLKMALEKQLVSAQPQEEEEEEEKDEAREELRLKKLASRGGRPKTSNLDLAVVPADAKRVDGQKRTRRELGAFEKMAMCKYIDENKVSHAQEKDLWKHCRIKFGITVQQAKDIYCKKNEWTKLVTKHQLGKRRGPKKGKRKRPPNAKVRAEGGGRKREFDQQVSALKHWLGVERSHGHYVSKRELLHEFCVLLTKLAEECAFKAKEEPNTKKAEDLNKQAQQALQRKEKLLNGKTSYGKNFTEKLIGWCNAKWMQKELSHTLSPLEAKVRAQLTYQHIDRVLYMMTAASKEELQEEDIIASPEELLKTRHLVSITMSDQVPLWAKSRGHKMIFAEQELVGLRYEEGDRMADLRKEIAAAQQQLSSKEQMIHGSTAAAEASEPKPKVAGMKTIRHESYEDKYRITYEARQKVSNLISDEAPIGEISGGLLVFGGPHQRLSNLSSTGTYLEDESFYVGDTLVEHHKGEACKTLKWAVALRNKHPEYFEDLEIMQQPSSNLDSVLMKWVSENHGKKEPHGILLKDCFAANFADEVRTVQYLQNQASVEILGHLTAQLQVTDTDVSRTFKSKFRRSLDEQRRKYKKEKGTEKGFSVGYEEIIVAALSAQKELQEENNNTNFVVKATVRNGLLAYTTNSKGEFKAIHDQPWHSEEFSMGSKRIPDSWLLNRFQWLENDVPIKPDFSLMGQATQVQDLIEWSNKPAPTPGNEPLEDDFDIPEDALIQPELLLPLENSLFLRLDPDLRRAALRREKLEKDYASVLEAAREKQAKNKTKQLPKKAARKFLSAKLLNEMSRKEALKSIIPKSTNKKKLGKKVLKAAAKKKCHKAGKGSLAKKALLSKMGPKKVLAGLPGKKAPPKDIPAIADKEKAPPKDVPAIADKEKAPPKDVPAIADKKAKAAKKNVDQEAEDTFSGQQVRVISLDAGEKCFGAKGQATKVKNGKVTIVMDHGIMHVQLDHLCLEEATWKAPAPFLPGNKVTRAALQTILEAIACMPLPFEEKPELEDDAEVLPLLASGFLEDQQIVIGWEWMKWQLKIPHEIMLLDPTLSYRMGLPASSSSAQGTKETIVALCKGITKLLVPCQGRLPDHWTLLIGERDAEEKDFAWRYKDSLKNIHQGCLKTAKQVISALTGQEWEEVVLEREKTFVQAGCDCGFYVLAFCEEEATQVEGPASRGWPERVKSAWEKRFPSIVKQLQAEFGKLNKVKLDKEEKEKALKAKKEKEKEVLEAKLKKFKDITCAAAVAAQALLDENSKYFRWQSLSSTAKHEIWVASCQSTGCSKCRYGKGCLACSLHALKYWLRRESEKKQKVPLVEGPGGGRDCGCN